MSSEAAAREKTEALLAAAGCAVRDCKAFYVSSHRGTALCALPVASGH